MNYTRLASPLSWILTFFILLFVYTKFFGPISFSINSVTTTKSDTFNVSGEGKVYVVPDLAVVNVGVRAQGQTVKVAQDQMNSNINAVTEAIKKLGIDSKDIQTTNYSINPDYDYSNQPQKIKGYSASSTVQVKVKDTEKLNSVIDISTANGANEVYGISFDVSDKTKAENEAREKAVSDAKKKAEAASKIAGFKLGRLVNYSESPVQVPIPFRATAISEDVEAPKPEVEAGSQEITVTATLSYEIL